MPTCQNISTSFSSGPLIQKISQSFTAIKESLQYRPGELSSFLLPVGVCAGGALLLSMPSVAYAIMHESMLPAFVLKGAGLGVLLGAGQIAYERWSQPKRPSEVHEVPHYKTLNCVSLIRLNGVIDSKKSFSADRVIPLLESAFENSDSKGVILKINSGGGSAAQSSLIYKAILRLKKKYNKTVVAVGEDLLASGAYFVAAAADKIYVDANTLTGSIGVIAEDFGVVDLAKKLGVTHRVYTSGKYKRRLDMFLPESKDNIEKIQEDLKEVHQNFIAAVLRGRDGKLNAGNEVLFSGDYWIGKCAKELGLVDELGDIYDVMEQEFQVTRFVEERTNSLSFFPSLLSHFSLFPKEGVQISIEPEANTIPKLRYS